VRARVLAAVAGMPFWECRGGMIATANNNITTSTANDEQKSGDNRLDEARSSWRNVDMVCHMHVSGKLKLSGCVIAIISTTGTRPRLAPSVAQPVSMNVVERVVIDYFALCWNVHWVHFK